MSLGSILMHVIVSLLLVAAGWALRDERTASAGARKRAEAREVERWAGKTFHKVKP